MKSTIVLVILCGFIPCLTYAQWVSDGSNMTREEYKLYTLVNQYRASKGLPSIPLSKSLTAVAQTHARDLHDHFTYGGRCNMHSWSGHGIWTSCCYTPDHAQAKQMWNKPSQITPYSGNGYEDAYMSTEGCTAEGALEGWKHSPGHNATIVNLDKWHGITWKAIGVAIYKDYSVLWLGEESDPVSGTPIIVNTQDEVYDKPSSCLKNTYTPKPQKLINTVNTTRNNTYNSRIGTTTSSQNTYSSHTVSSSLSCRERFYNRAGKGNVAFVSLGYTYNTTNNIRLINASLLDFRCRMFGASLLNFEMGINPDEEWYSYKPSLKIYFPVCSWMAIVLNGGAVFDASAIKKRYDQDVEDDTVIEIPTTVCGGLSIYIVPVKYVPIELKVEYGYDIVSKSPIDGVSLGTIIHIGR